MSQRTIKSWPLGLGFLFTLVWAPTGLAGGFQIKAELPAPSSDPALKEVVLVVRPDGCHRPTDATLSGTAEGIVDGRRQSLPLEFTLTSTGVYAIEQQWPSRGVWVLAITGAYRGMTRSLLIELGPGGAVQTKHRLTGGQNTEYPARIFQRKIAAGEIEAALQNLARKTN